jgi:hypothetical protein
VTNEDQRRLGELEQANAKLSESLKRCRRLVADCRSKLAANGNEPAEESVERASREG